MPRIIVNDCTYSDPRFRVLGRELRCSAETATVRCMQLWSRATAQRSARFALSHLAAGLRCREDRIAEVLSKAEIGHMTLDGEFELQLADVFGKLDWYEQVSEEKSGQNDGNARARGDRDLRGEVLAALRLGPLSRRRLRDRLRCRAETLSQVVRGLLDSGAVLESSKGLALGGAIQEPLPHVFDPLPGMGAEDVPGSSSMVPGSMDLALDLAPDHAPESSASSAWGVGNGREALEDVLPGSAAPTHDCAALFRYWDHLGRKLLGESWRAPPADGGQHRVAKALRDRELSTRSDESIRHGLDMLYEEVLERRKQKDPDPAKFFLLAWSPGVLNRACDMPDELTARARVTGRMGLLSQREGPTSVQPLPHEFYAAAAAEEDG